MNSFICLIIFNFIALPGFAKGTECRAILENRENTQRVILFYDQMINKGAITINDLHELSEALIENLPLPDLFLNTDNSEMEAVRRIRRDIFLAIKELSYSNLDLQRWVNQKIREQLDSEALSERVSQTTQSTFNPVVFYPIKKGSFKYSKQSNSEVFEVELLQDFEMQSTPVTQGQWIELMGFNPSIYQSDDPRKTQNHPVENITIWSAMAFANKLSLKHGYEPVYDLSNISMAGTPEDGSHGDEDYSIVGDIIINAPGGDLYKAEGYRLQTLAEYFMVISDRGHFSSDQEVVNFFKTRNMLDYYHANKSISGTLESGSLLPMNSNGYKFYDLMGNVASFTSDIQVKYHESIAGVNPLVPFIGESSSKILTLAGSPPADSKLYFFQFSSIYSNELWNSAHRNGQTGFRLVRTLK